jgi:glycosyltransferase involved in cell wall biosynthesis
VGTDEGLVSLRSTVQTRFGIGGRQARIEEGWQFTLKEVPDGTFRVHVSGLSEDCYIKEVRFGETVLPDVELRVRGGSANLEITMSSRGARVQGQVLSQDDLPVVGAWVVVVLVGAGLVEVAARSTGPARSKGKAKMEASEESTLSGRRNRLCGIVNGVDYGEWDPAIDPHIPVRYDSSTVFAGKPECKVALQQSFRLPEWSRTPVFGLVARLAEQKGIELLLEVGEQILKRDAQLVVLGEGDSHYHYWLQQLRDHFPQRVGVYFGFSEPLAHLIEAGADAFLMPSKYEPSGLNQLYSLRYGTVPVVRDVGGLHDTITDANEENLAKGIATGFRFGPYTGPAFLAAVERAMTIYRHRPEVWRQIIHTGMAQDWSWDRSAGEYEGLYRRITGG